MSSGKLLEFKTPDAYAQRLTDSSDTELTGLELFQKLFDYNQEHLLRIIKAHKSTGGWNPTAEQMAVRIRENLKALSANVAGARDAKKKSSQKVSQQPIVSFTGFLGGTGVGSTGGSGSGNDFDNGPRAV